MLHRMALGRFTASARNGDSAAALTASEARRIREWPGPICSGAAKGSSQLRRLPGSGLLVNCWPVPEVPGAV